jgi:lipopolysaccharide transport system permease protein
MLSDYSKKETRVYRPNQRLEMGCLETLAVMFRSVIRSRELVGQLFKRDFFAKHNKSFLGVTWIFLTPILGVITWIFFKKAGVLSPGDVGVPYIVFIVVGISMWALFLGAFNSTSRIFFSASKLITQVNLPREAIIVKQLLLHLATFSVLLLLNVLILLFYGVTISWTIIFFPLVIIPMLLLGTAMGMLVSLASVVARDIENGVKMVMKLMLFSIPIIYSSNVKVAWLKPILKYNPLTHLVCSARDILIHGTLYDTGGYIVCSFGALLFFIIVCRFFYIAENKIIEKVLL